MLLLYVTVCVLFGSAAGIEYEKACYGRSLRLPLSYTPPLFRGQLYFTPINGGSRKLLMDNGEAKDKRLEVSIGSVEFTHLTEKDEGIFSISFDNYIQYDIVKLTILDCAEKITKYYGAKYTCDIYSVTEFLEFTPLHGADQTKVLWDLTNPQTNKGGRGRVRGNVWEIMDVTQADMGYYNFRARDNTLMSRKLLTVQEYKRHYNKKVNEQLVIQNPPAVGLWTVTFTPERGGEDYTLMKAGSLVTEDDWKSRPWTFKGRIWVMRDGIEIYPVKSTDSGTFEFRDPQGNLAQTVKVEVKHDPTPTSVNVTIIVWIIFAGIVCCCCCCCVRKCCCKKSSSKRDDSVSQTDDTPTVYYHDLTQPAGYAVAPAPDYSHQPMNSLVSGQPKTTSLEPSDLNQPGGPSYSDATAQVYSHQPMNSLVSREPKTTSLEPSDLTQPAGYAVAPAPDYSHQPMNSLVSGQPKTTSLEPPVYNPVNIHVNSPQPEFAPLGEQGTDPAPSLGSDCLFSDSEPKFELKVLPSAPPLSSDPTLCDVYSSDKLNFL